MAAADLLDLRKWHFTFWNPAGSTTPPVLVIGTFEAGNPNQLANALALPLRDDGRPGLWTLPAADTGLADGIYHYWFRVPNTHPTRPAGALLLCTDPYATTVDWRLLSPDPGAGFDAGADRQPAAVIRLRAGTLEAVDPGGEAPAFRADAPQNSLPPNNRIVIYELPTVWASASGAGASERGVGTFQDARALVEERAAGANFEGLSVLAPGRSYIADLGVNAIELLPPADSFFKRAWGYDTAHFLAPDWEMGFPEGQAASTSNRDLAQLVESCHHHGVRVIVDAVMAFGRNEAHQWVNFDDFYLADAHKTPGDKDAEQSRAGGIRDGFGSTLFRYTRDARAASYDPVSGGTSATAPARALMYTYITRWLRDFHVDGVRMDSVENVANWDFVGGFKDQARSVWRDRWNASGQAGNADAGFLVVGEELSRPLGLLTQGRLDALWNDEFRARVRAAILGENVDNENFEWTVRKAIDCRHLGFTDLAQTVNYVTSHDVEGFRKERLFTMLSRSGFAGFDLAKRIQLAFVCLLTANGIPMFVAGEEFADQHDLFDADGNVSEGGGKQMDPVNFSRAEEPFRKSILAYVSKLVHLRTSHPALAVNDTEFIHADFDGKRVMAWKRGFAGQEPVVVVANFSDYATPGGLTDPSAEYVVNNWPAIGAGRRWREVTQGRDVLPWQVGREPIFPWEAKVYVVA